jgi:hypothetical protein
MNQPPDDSTSIPQSASPQEPATSEPALFGDAAAAGRRNWIPWIAGFAVVLVAIALLVVFGGGKPKVAAEADPYAPMLQVTQMRLSQAENFVGATITYIDLTVRNDGPRTVAGGVAQVTFRDTLGQVVQTETLPLRALSRNPLGGADEATDLSNSPLGPKQTKALRLTVEHISSQWNLAQPEIEFRGLRFQAS